MLPYWEYSDVTPKASARAFRAARDERQCPVRALRAPGIIPAARLKGHTPRGFDEKTAARRGPSGFYLTSKASPKPHSSDVGGDGLCRIRRPSPGPIFWRIIANRTGMWTRWARAPHEH